MIGVRQIDVCRIDQEHRLHFALQGTLHHPDSHAGVLHFCSLVEAFLRNTPLLGAPGPVLVIFNTNIERQPAGQSASEAFTHGVGLAGLRMRAATGASNVASQGH